MAPKNYLAQIALKSTSGLATDAYVVDQVVTDTTGVIDPDTVALDIAGKWVDFYNNVDDAGHSIVSKLSPQIRTEFDVSLYDITAHLAGTPFGSPIAVHAGDLGARSAAGPLPEECAIALSVTADIAGVVEKSGATRPRARRRGRLFLGPWAQNAVAGPVGGHTFIDIDLQHSICFQAAAMRAGMLEQDLEWGVWSRKDAVVRPVVGGFLDNAFDTIRSRGAGPNGRTIWP